jgi:CheY-like chemotaxis protein
MGVHDNQQPMPAADQSGKATAVKRRVLVADDNADSALSLAMILKFMGHETQTAHDGLTALELAETFRPEVAILDLGMPRLNGYELCHRIRQQPWGKSMLLVALTGWGQEDDRRRTQEAGFDHHIVKPIDTATLQRLLAS